MTVNERLVMAGLMDEFDAAVRRRDQQQVIALLQQVELSEEQAQWTAGSLFADPRKYGY